VLRLIKWEEKNKWGDRICIVVVAVLEPTYQASHMSGFPIWSIIAVWTNLFLFNLTQLVIFKKYDFLSMYLARLIYYFVWHIAWGFNRLNLLF